MSGRQTKTLHEQDERYGIPFGRATINLFDVARSLHDFLAKNTGRLELVPGDDPLSGPSSPALERYRLAAAIIKELEAEEKKKELVPRDTVRECFGLIAARIRQAGDQIKRRDRGSADILRDALEDARRQLDTHLEDRVT